MQFDLDGNLCYYGVMKRPERIDFAKARIVNRRIARRLKEGLINDNFIIELDFPTAVDTAALETARKLRAKIGPVPSRRAWKIAAGHKDFGTYIRSKNQLFEYQHAFWRVVSEPIDSQG